MGKLGLVLVGLVFVLGSINFITAGTVSTEGTATSAKQIKLSGEIETPMISRDKGINSVLDGMASQDGDTIWSPLITLNVGIDVGDKITSLIQLQNRRLNAGIGTAANVDFFGGNNIDPAVKQAYVKFEKFVTQDLNFTYGLQNLKFTVREGEGAFLIDTGNASSSGFLTEPTGGVWLGRTKTAGEFGGFRFDYSSLKNNNYQGALFAGKIAETATGANQLHNDTSLNGAIVWYKLKNDKIFNAIVTQFLNPKLGTDIRTVGVGADYKDAMPNLGIFGEFYSQRGDYSKVQTQSATAYRAGLHYDIKRQEKYKPYVEVSYWLLTGGGTAGRNKNFVSLENVKSTMILEDDVFGLDLDSNYVAIKEEAGITTKVDIDKDGASEELKIKILIGQFTLKDQPTGLSGVSERLGTEIDLVGTLQFNPSVGFTIGYATLNGGRFFTNTQTYNTDYSSMRMLIVCTNLKF